MFADLLSAHYDSYHPDFSLTLVNSLKSYINLKLDHERKTFDFIKELRRRLYFIHEYNCQVARLTHQYPRSRKLDLLLIKYVEIEFDVLYNSSYVSRQLEEATELRVLRLLQVMLYPAVLNNETLINKNTDTALKKAVLRLLGEVRSTYLAKNRLVYNIAHKLLKKVGGTFRKNHTSVRSVLDIRGNLATSDYGSEDSDSDFENNVIFNDSSPRAFQNFVKKGSDCFEVPLVTNGQTPVPTVEFTDDDSYFVYLQKPTSSKRKNNEDFKSEYRKRVFGETKNCTDNSDLINITSKNKKLLKNTSPAETTCVVICSDSEDEVSPADKTKCQVRSEQNIVTFEILDDDDDDDGQTNYMVYLQKEVKAKTKPKEKSKAEEIVICSDSEDDTCIEDIQSKIEQNHETERTDLPKLPSKCNQTVPSLQVECPVTSQNGTSCENTFKMLDETSDDLHNEIHANLESDASSLSLTDCALVENEVKPPVQPDVQIPSTSTDVNTYFLNFSAQVSNNEISNTNGLVDPSDVLQQIIPIFVNKEESLTKQWELSSSSQAEFEAEIPGGPLMSEKADSVEELGNVSECRLNESLLEELLDDTYLLEGRKEFEELEYFLFNDSADKGGFCLSNDTLDNIEITSHSQPETFDADIKSLESFLNDSQLINWTDSGNLLSDSFGSPLRKALVDSKTQNNSDKFERKDTFSAKKANSKVTFKHPGRVSRR